MNRNRYEFLEATLNILESIHSMAGRAYQLSVSWMDSFKAFQNTLRKRNWEKFVKERQISLSTDIYRKQFFAYFFKDAAPFFKQFNYGFFSEFYTRPYYRNSNHPPGGM